MSEIDRDYYLARLRAEREAAATATSEVARAAHSALADEYANLLEGGRPEIANDSRMNDSVRQITN